MPTQILAVGSTDTSSSDVTIAAGDSLTVALNDAAGPVVASGCIVDIELKDSTGQYFLVDTLSVHKPALVISGAGTYRFTRKNRGGVSCGVFSG